MSDNTVYMSNNKISSLGRLYSTFPMLTEANQQYILCYAEGLKKEQNKGLKVQSISEKNKLKKANG